jgi:hypothetical protein
MASKSAGKSWPECGESRTSGTAGFIAVGYLSMETYYAKRAAEYEKIYHKPERQADLARLRDDLPALFAGSACSRSPAAPATGRR